MYGERESTGTERQGGGRKGYIYRERESCAHLPPVETFPLYILGRSKLAVFSFSFLFPLITCLWEFGSKCLSNVRDSASCEFDKLKSTN